MARFTILLARDAPGTAKQLAIKDCDLDAHREDFQGGNGSAQLLPAMHLRLPTPRDEEYLQVWFSAGSEDSFMDWYNGEGASRRQRGMRGRRKSFGLQGKNDMWAS
jgi:hypothetical protein